MRLGEIPLAELRWPATFRLVPSRFPPISLFERVAHAADLDVVFAIEALTNPRLRKLADGRSRSGFDALAPFLLRFRQ